MKDVLCDTKYLQLKQTVSKSGKPWFYAHRPNADGVVVILPVSTDGEVLFIIEERPPLKAENRGKYVIGLPAGLVGDERKGETIEDAIKSELLEEAGLKAESIKIVAPCVSSSAGCISEVVTIAIVKIKNKKTISVPIDDDGIIVDRMWVKRENIYTWLNDMTQKGYVHTSQTLAALYFLEMEENK